MCLIVCLLCSLLSAHHREVNCPIGASAKWLTGVVSLIEASLFNWHKLPYCVFICHPPGFVYAVTRGNRCGATKALARDWRSRPSSSFSSSQGYTTPCECTHTHARPHQHPRLTDQRHVLVKFISLSIFLKVHCATFFFTACKQTKKTLLMQETIVCRS